MVTSLFSSKKLLPDIWVPTFEIKIDEKSLPEDVAKSVQQVSVIQTLGQANNFTFQLNDPKLKLINRDGLLTEGKKVEISMGYVGKEKKRKLLVGKISAVSVSFPSSGAAAIQVQGFDRSHELTYGTFYRRFEPSLPDSQIVNQIAEKIGFKVSVDATPPRKEARVQENISNLHFFTDLAIANGYSLWIEHDELYFKKTPPKSETITLEYGKTLLSFEPRLSTAEQVSQVVVQGWDPIQKQSFRSQPEKVAKHAADILASTSQQVIDNGSGKPSERVINNAAVASEKDAQVYAESIAKSIASKLITGSGTSVGDPDLQVFTKLTLKGIGRFEGEYSVQQVTHSISESGYQISFQVNGAPQVNNAPNLPDVLMGDESGTSDRRRQYGVMIGLVMDNQDPNGLGRVKVKFPGWSDDEIGHWARMATPMAGDQRGFFCLPEVKDEVLVAFEQGDMSRPYIVGALWNGKDKPPSTNADGKNNIRVIQSRSGSLIRFDDTKGGEKIEIQDKNGDNGIVIDIAKGAIVIKSSKDISIEAAQGTIKLNAQNIEISSTASTKIEAIKDLNLSATGNTNVKGTMINLN